MLDRRRRYTTDARPKKRPGHMGMPTAVARSRRRPAGHLHPAAVQNDLVQTAISDGSQTTGKFTICTDMASVLTTRRRYSRPISPTFPIIRPVPATTESS
jgi:hypothetical protein